MQETQIKVEYDALSGLFPFYLKLLLRREKINLISSKFQRDKATFKINISKEKRTELIEKFYNFNNLFNIQKIEYEY